MKHKNFCIVFYILSISLVLIFLKQNIPSGDVTTLSRLGSRGEQVREIQTRLSRWGYYTGNVDGIYGPLTQNAVRRFQQNNNLTVDGIAGPQTLAAMGIAATNTSGPAHLDLMARVIHGEARGEPYEGQVAVGAVVMNRVRDSRFPNTIPGVIYQPNAFDAVADGQINLQPNETAYRAARDAMNGWDPTYGCIYYYNPATATSAWIWSRPIKLRIGKHNFAT